MIRRVPGHLYWLLFWLSCALETLPSKHEKRFKMVKQLQNFLKTYLNPILWFSKCFQVNVYAVMFKKRFINILYTNIFTENVY